MNNITNLKPSIKYKIIFSLIVFIPFLIILLSGKVIFWGTASLQFIPWDQFLFDNILQGNLPLWNPYNGMGVPFIANHQSAAFYPLNWLLFFFNLVFKTPGLAVGMTLLIPVHLVIGGLGMMKILEEMQRTNYAQLIAAISLSLSGYILTRTSFISMVWTFAWFPWIIFSCIQLKRSNKRFPIRETSILSGLVALQLLAGHAQTSFYTLLLGGIIVVFYEIKKIRETFLKLINFALAILFSILVAAIQVLPTAEFLLNSQRSEEVGFEFATSLSVWPGRLITIIFGNFWGNPNYSRFLSGGNFWEENMYLGVFSILFMTILAWSLFRKNRKDQIDQSHKPTLILFSVVLIFSILFSMGKHFPLFSFLYNYIPVFNLFQAPSRFLLIYYFVISIFVGFGIDLWISSKYNVRKTGIIFVVFGTLTIISIIMLTQFPDFPRIMVFSLLYGSITGILFATLTILKDKTNLNTLYIKLILGIFIIIDLIYHNFMFENFQTIEINKFINNQQNNSGFSRVFLNQQDESFIKFNLYYRPDRLQPLIDLKDYQPTFIPDTNLMNNRYAMVNNFDPLQPVEFTEFWDWLQPLSMDEQISMLTMIGTQKYIDLVPEESTFLREKILPGRELVQWYSCAQEEDVDHIIQSGHHLLN